MIKNTREELMCIAPHVCLSKPQKVQYVQFAILPCGVKYRMIPETREMRKEKVVNRDTNPLNLNFDIV